MAIDTTTANTMLRPPVTLGLLRHGQTYWNSQKRIQGSSDSPLTAEGQKMVARWARSPLMKQWSRIVVSDLGRAQETALILNEVLQLPMYTEPNLREQDWGEWETHTFEEIRSQTPEILEEQVRSGWNFRAPGGESRKEVYQRASIALNSMVATWPDEKILVVCHQGVIQCLLYHIKERLFLPSEKKILHKHSLHTLAYSNNRFRITDLNLPLVPST